MSLVVSGRSRVLHAYILWGCQALPIFMLLSPICTQKQHQSSVTMPPCCWLIPKACHSHSGDPTCKCHIFTNFCPSQLSFQRHQGLGDCRINWEVTRQPFSFVSFQKRHMATILSCSQEQPLNSLAIDGKTQTKIKVIINVTQRISDGDRNRVQTFLVGDLLLLSLKGSFYFNPAVLS